MIGIVHLNLKYPLELWPAKDPQTDIQAASFGPYRANLRPILLFQGRNSKLNVACCPLQDRICFGQARSRAEEPATSGPTGYALQPSVRGRLRAATPVPGANSAFKIQDSKLNGSAWQVWTYVSIRAAACGAHADSDTNCGPPPPPGCGPLGPDGPGPCTTHRR